MSQNRLQHSTNGLLRTLQISSIRLFVFVEGPSDQFFISELVNSIRIKRNMGRAEIILSREITGTGGGKRRLLQFFAHLRRKKQLSGDSFGKRFECIFFLDKDVDDIRRTRKRSHHLIYTEYYQMENHVFRETDLIHAAAAAASLPKDDVLGVIGDPSAWLRKTAEAWRDWVVLCIISALGEISSENTYSVPSRINHDSYGSLNPQAVSDALSLMETRSGMQPQAFNSLHDKALRLVNRHYKRGLHDKIFKGKWYLGFLAHELKSSLGNKLANQNGLEERLLSSALAILDFEGAWANQFQAPLEDAARRLT